MKRAALVIGMDGSLIGNEFFLDDLLGTKKQLDPGSEEEGDVRSCIIIGFLGIFKGETGEIYRLTLVASTTDSWIEVRKWIVLLIVSMGKKGNNNGYMLQD